MSTTNTTKFSIASTFIQSRFPTFPDLEVKVREKLTREISAAKLRALIQAKRVNQPFDHFSKQARYSFLRTQLKMLNALKDPRTKELVGDLKNHLSRARLFLRYLGVGSLTERMNEELHAAEVDLCFIYTKLLFTHLGVETTQHLLSNPFGVCIEIGHDFQFIQLHETESRQLFFQNNGLDGFITFFTFAFAQRISGIGNAIIYLSTNSHRNEHEREKRIETLKKNLLCVQDMMHWLGKIPDLKNLFERKWNELKGEHISYQKMLAMIKTAEEMVTH